MVVMKDKQTGLSKYALAFLFHAYFLCDARTSTTHVWVAMSFQGAKHQPVALQPIDLPPELCLGSSLGGYGDGIIRGTVNCMEVLNILLHPE